jgi:hypothetical protein
VVANTVAIATIALILHIFSAVVWVGGMFFALFVLRPATAALEPGTRLDLWLRVFERFFVWVFAAIVLLLASGYAMIFGVYAGFSGIGLHVHNHAGNRHHHDAVVFPPVFRAVAALSRGGGAPGSGRRRGAAWPDPDDRDGEPTPRSPDRRRGQQRSLLGLRP